MSFKAKRGAAKEIASGTRMRQHMQSVAEDMAKNQERRAPAMVRNNGKFIARTVKTDDGWGAEAGVKSPFWHWGELGTSGRHFRTPAPYLRPGAQQTLSRLKGRWKTQ